MKHLKQLLSLVLAVAMTLCLGIVGAAETETSSTTTHTYELYQIFTGTVDNGTITDIKWGLNGTGTKDTAVEESVATNLNAAINATDDQTKLKTITKYAKLDSDPYRTSNTTSFSEVASGYYLIKDKDNSLANEADAAYTLYVVVVTKGGELTFSTKSSVPTVEKKIIEDGTAVDENDVAIGGTVHYQITGTLPSNYGVYANYSYKFTDTMSAGLTYNNDVKVYLDKVDEENVMTGYQLSVENNVLTITFEDLKANTKINKDSKIIVKYSATLNTDATIGNDEEKAPNTNTVTLTYSNNPNGSGTGTTTPDTVVTKTWSFSIHKYAAGDSAEANLAGAVFQLSTDAEGKNVITLAKIDDKGEIYRISVADDTNTTNEVTTVSTGNLVIQGLDSGTYYLTETDAPAGYQQLTSPIVIVIDASGNFTVTNGDVTTKSNTISVANEKVTATLPTTGGMGTTAIYIAGGLMVMAAAILLIVKKQTNK
jgi:fimbrial isopeptide formation D2 family protein/LPXTG-motif cell wall-anchored protein